MLTGLLCYMVLSILGTLVILVFFRGANNEQD